MDLPSELKILLEGRVTGEVYLDVKDGKILGWRFKPPKKVIDIAKRPRYSML